MEYLTQCRYLHLCCYRHFNFYGPAQTASRALMIKLSPQEKMTEFFGLYAFAGKSTAWLVRTYVNHSCLYRKPTICNDFHYFFQFNWNYWNVFCFRKMISNYLNFISKKSQITIFILLNLCGLIFFLLPHNIFWNMLDLRFSYTREILMQSFDTIGEEGRQLYFISSLVIDTIYPLLYVSLFLGAYYKLFRENSFIFIFPLASGLFDILENIQISLLLLNFPIVSSQNIFYSSTSTSIKWAMIGISVSILIYGVVKKRREK